MAEIKNINYSVTLGANGNSVVTVNIADLNLSKSVKIKKAVVPLTVTSDNLHTDAEFDVTCKLDLLDCGLIDRLSGLTQGQEIEINITDELQKAIDSSAIQLIINFTDAEQDNPTTINFEKTVGNNKTTNDIEYISKAEYSANGTSHSVDLGTAGQASVNLSTGTLNIVHQDVQSDSNVLPLSISHVYNSFGTKLPSDASISNHYGDGWKLNLEQYLVEKTINIPLDNGESKEQSTGEYEYFDENGKKQIIVEKYYYTITNESGGKEKHYVERTDSKLFMNLDGELQYNKGTDTSPDIVSVETEWEAPSGLKLVTKKADIKGANLVDTEPDELLQLREQLKSVNRALEQIDFTLEQNKKQLCIFALSKKALDKQLDFQVGNIEDTEKNYNDTKQIEKNMAYLKKTYRTFDGRDYARDYIQEKYFSKENLNDFVEFYENNKELTDINDNKLISDDVKHLANQFFNEASHLLSLGNDYEAQTSGSLYMQKMSNDFNKELYCTNIDQQSFNDLIDSAIGENFTQQEKQDWFYSQYDSLKNENNVYFSAKDLEAIDLQIESCIFNIKEYITQQADYLDQKAKLQNQIRAYERQIPQFYLYSDSVIYGFSPIITEKLKENSVDEIEYVTIPHIYRLNYIADTYENSIVINYEKNTNKIENVIDSQDNVITFAYKTISENNITKNLVIITDAQDRKVTFTVQNNLLTKVTYNDDTTSQYLYKSENGRNCLIAAIGINGIGAKFDYDSNKVVKVQQISMLSMVQDGKIAFHNLTFTHDDLDYMVQNGPYINIEYKNYASTTITSIKKTDSSSETLKSLTYVFDNEGRVRTVYENTFDETNPNDSNPVVKSFDYVADKKQISVEPLLNSQNYMDDVCFDDNAAVPVPANYFGNGLLEGDDIYCSDDIYCETYLVHMQFHSYTKTDENFNKSLTVSNAQRDKIKSLVTDVNHPQTRFILGCWAKADSAFVFNPDNDGNINDYPDYIKTRKFELRAEVTYSGESTPVVFSKCFDWLNTEWQYCAVPIEFDKTREISSIVCYFDYSNNTITESTPVYFTDFSLKEASYEERTYNNKLLTEVISSHSKWKQVCEYDDNDRLTKLYYYDITQNKSNRLVNEFYYNKNGKLFKTIDFKGIVTEKVFNENGIEIQTKKYHKDNPAEIMFTEQKLGEKGEVLADYNELGEEINSYDYVAGTGIVSTVADKQGNKTAYGYDTKNGTLLQMSSDVDGISNTNTYGYTAGFLTKVSHNGFDISYDYGAGSGRLYKIKIAGSEYLTVGYSERPTSTFTTSIYSNNEGIRTVTDKNGNVTQVLYAKNANQSFEPILQNVYDTHGNLMATNDKITNTTREYTLDKFGNTTLQTDTQHGVSVNKTFVYDEYQNNISTSLTIDAETRNYDYTYNTVAPESILEKVTYSKNVISAEGATTKEVLAYQEITNDKLDRTHEITLTSGTKTNTRLFHYLKNGLHTSNQVSSIWFGDNDKYLDNLKYKYDEKGNITEVYENSILQTRYKYDSLSRLIREDNKLLNKTTTWEYDAGGNIVNRFEYEFTTANDLNEKTPTIIPYSYATSGIRDKLMEYKDEQFEYDAIGNPSIYRNNVLTWEKGRQLKSFGNIASYTYNASGVRIGKTVGSTTTQYFRDGTKILAQKDIVSASENATTETFMKFIYGIDGIIGFTLTNTDGTDTNYYYKKNLQGDIIGIYDNNLQIIVKYDYDAWGNHNIKFVDSNGDLVDFDANITYNTDIETNLYVALKNPFRYRSYYYDTETGLYYLNSRYYDPETGRFINIDEITVLDVTNIALNGINLYAYCLNNPVNDTDSNGDMPDWLKWLLGGLAFIGAIVLTVVSGGSLAPVFIGMGVSIVGSGLIQGAITASSGGSFWSGFASGAADGAMWGGIFAFAGAAINTIKYFATTTKLYRAVSTAEYQSIKNTGKFSLKIGAFEGKQFGFKLNEVRKYANLPFNNGMYSKIVAVRVPKAELNAIMQKTFTDAFVFKSGIATIIDMDALNAIIKTIRYLNL